jgi:hypothetical protein
MTFDSIVYMPGLTTGVPNLYIWITGSRTGADGRPEPDLGNILFFGNFGLYPGDPLVLDQNRCEQQDSRVGRCISRMHDYWGLR